MPVRNQDSKVVGEMQSQTDVLLLINMGHRAKGTGHTYRERNKEKVIYEPKIKTAKKVVNVQRKYIPT